MGCMGAGDEKLLADMLHAGDCLHSSLLRIKRGEEAGGSRWSTCFAFLIFSIVFMGDLFFIGHFIIDKLLG